MHGAQQAIEDEQANGQQDGRLDTSAPGQLRLPASRRTVTIARKISWREILDWPRARSVNVGQLGDRTWLRRRSTENGADITVYEAADGGGTLIVEFACWDPVCRGAAGDWDSRSSPGPESP